MKAVAIIGIGCKFPKATGPAAFWDLLVNQKDAISLLSEARRKQSRLFDSLTPDVLSKFYGGFLEGIEGFDAEFFQISQREAIYLDPQQRLLMQVVWEALEDAGIVPSKLKGSQTGVFIGASTHEYSVRSFVNLNLVTPYTGIGNASSILANRISYQLDLHGPSMAIDTACSSSLVAVHQACQYLQEQSESVAIAGGVNLILAPQGNEMFSQAKALAANGRCKTFDSKADGIVRSEGLGVVVLKPLEKAIADGDPIYAVIRGSAVNQDGKTNGLMAPNRWAQEKVLTEALKSAAADPSNIQFIEAHGTGTLLGDPIEANALGSIFANGRDSKAPLKIGSVKTNIGHTESAAGVAGLIKVALSLKHGVIPASLHFHDPNPYIDFEKLKLKVASEPSVWDTSEGKNPMAGVSSFGFGGTNAHIVVEKYASPQPKQTSVPASSKICLFPLSARTGAAIRGYAKKYLDLIEHADESPMSLEKLAYNVAVHRTHFENRVAIPAQNISDLKIALKSIHEQEFKAKPRPANGGKSPTVFVFSGQGSQWHGMALNLIATDEVFRSKMEECSLLIQKEAGWSLLDELKNKKFDNVGEKYQPMIFAISVSIAEIFAKWGIKSERVIGHSMGEIAAAHVAGMLSLGDAVKIICRRSRLMARLEGQGAMAMVELSRSEAEEWIKKYDSKLSIGGSNGPRSVVLTGDPATIARAIKDLDAKNVFAKQVKTEVACHSAQLDPVKEQLRQELSDLTPLPGNGVFYSTVHCKTMKGEELGADYWADNVREPVSFYETIVQLIRDGARTFVELSPHALLVSQIQETARSQNLDDVTTCGTLRRDGNDGLDLLKALGALYESGVNPDWRGIFNGEQPREHLPTYAWQEQKYWLEESAGLEWIQPPSLGFQGTEIKSADCRSRRMWNLTLGGRQHQYLMERRAQGTAMFPVAGFIEIATQIARKIFKDQEFILRDFDVFRPLTLKPDQESRLQVVMSPITQAGCAFEIHTYTKDHRSQSENGMRWELFARGTVETLKSSVIPTEYDLRIIRERLNQKMEGADFYRKLSQLGHQYDGVFQGVKSIHSGPTEALVELNAAENLPDEHHYLLHPAILDACMQGLLGPGLKEAGDSLPDVWIRGFGEIKLSANASGFRPKWSHVTADPESQLATLTLLDDHGWVLAEFHGIRYDRIEKKEERVNWPKRVEDWMYDIHWEVSPLASHEPLSDQDQILVFADQGEVASRVAELLNRPNIWMIRHGQQFRKSKDGKEWVINFQKASDFSKLVRQLKKKIANGTKVGFLNLASLDLLGEECFHISRLPSLSLLNLLKAIERVGPDLDYRMWMVTSGAQVVDTSKQETPNLFQSPIWGLCRSLMEEHHDHFAKIVDVSPSTSPHDVASEIIAEISSHDFETQIAYRAGTRFAPRLVRMQPKLSPALPVKFRGDRAYLLAGGLGKLGMVAAKWMIEKGARRLLILGRTKLPDRKSWKRIQPSHRAFAQVHAILELEKLGCQIDYRSVDVSDYAAVDKMINDYRSNAMPEISGVIHAAGMFFAKPFVDTSSREFEEVLRSKIDGAWNLHSIFSRPSDLDFFITFSSISAWLSSSYFGAYAAANAFLDSIVYYRRAKGLPGLAVNWGKWMDAPTGLSSRIRPADRKVGKIPFKPGISVLEDLIGTQAARAGVAVVHWPNFKKYYPRIAKMPFLNVVMSEVTTDSNSDKLSAELTDLSIRTTLDSLEGEARTKCLETYIIGTISKAVHCQVSEIPLAQPLNSLGIDSMIALEIKNAIARDVGVSVPVVLFLKGINVRDLASHLSKNYVKATDAIKLAGAAKKIDFSVQLESLSAADLDKILATVGSKAPTTERQAA